MPITTEEAAQIARAYKMSLTDAETLIRLADTYEDAVHLAVDFAGSNEERAGQADADARKKQDADAAAEHEKYEKYVAAHPKPQKPPRIDAQPQLRDAMTDRERSQAIEAAHVLNVKAAAEEKHDEVQQQSKDFYNWKASLRRPEQGGE